MNHIIQALKKSVNLSLLTAFCLCHHVKAFNVAEYFYTKGDISVRLSSGEVYVSSYQKGRLGCTLSRLPLIKKDETEASEEALMHKIATINHEQHKENPLFNARILSFDMFDSGRGLFPLMVGEHEPAKLYLMERYAPCTAQGEVIVKEKKEVAKPEEKKAKKSSQDKSSQDKSSQEKKDAAKKAEEKKEEPAPCELLSSDVLKDALGNDVGEIIAIEQINSAMVAVVVAPRGGIFGAPGSGIALVQIVEEAEKKDEKQATKDPQHKDAKKETPKMVRVLKQISVEGLTGKDTVRAYPLDCASPVVTLGGVSAAHFGQQVSLHWDKRLERLFIGLDVTSADSAQAQVAAVVVARIEHDEEEQQLVEQPKKQKNSEASKHSKNGETVAKEKEEEPKTKRILHAKLLFEPILSKVTLEEQVDYIVAHKGAQSHIMADELKTLWTGTQTPHLILLRRDLHTMDKGAVFALPLVSGKSFELGKKRKKVLNDAGKAEKITAKEGTPEHKKQVARNTAAQKALEAEALTLYRSMQKLDVTRGTLASVEQGVEELFFDTHPYTLEERRLSLEAVKAQDLFTLHSEAACVGGGTLNGYISDIAIHGDAVEVTVYTMDNIKEVYLSRPLLNVDGMVERWTLWRPLATVKNALSVGDTQTQRSYFDGQHDACAVSIEQKDGVAVHKRIKNADVSEEPLHMFASNVNELCKNQTMLGAREVVISQPYAEQEVVACAYSTKQLVISTLDRHQGVEISTFPFPCDMKSIRGIAVASVESKILFVGGYNGLYALVDACGNGWPLDKKINNLSADERAAFSFVRIGKGDRIRSLACDGQCLYILTNKTFERVDLMASTFGRDGEIVSTTLALCDALPDHGALDIFLDCVVSDKLALLATTRGFFRIDDNLDVRSVRDVSSCSWVRINVPCQEGPIVQLVPLSVTGLATDCARCGGGELYVLNSYAGYNTTRVTRYHVADCSRSEVSAETVQLLPDRFMKSEETTFIRLNDYTTSLAIDGGSCLLVHPGSDMKKSCLYQKEFPAEKSHAGAMRFARTPIKFELAENESIISAALSIATGKMLVTTTQGLRILD
jgi:hypothetical protein